MDCSYTTSTRIRSRLYSASCNYTGSTLRIARFTRGKTDPLLACLSTRPKQIMCSQEVDSTYSPSLRSLPFPSTKYTILILTQPQPLPNPRPRRPVHSRLLAWLIFLLGLECVQEHACVEEAIYSIPILSVRSSPSNLRRWW